MYRYLIQPPSWIQWIHFRRIWRVKTDRRVLYLTFDDGPHPVITPFVLDQLQQYQAKASFFCIGNRVKEYPEVYQQILSAGHRVGNHTHSHLNGWKTSAAQYKADIAEAARYIQSALFRPPYGRMRPISSRHLANAMQRTDAQIVMWDLLSGDFDTKLSGEDCFEICRNKWRPGSIIVMHDSEKAWDRLSVLLPKLLEAASREGYSFESLP